MRLSIASKLLAAASVAAAAFVPPTHHQPAPLRARSATLLKGEPHGRLTAPPRARSVTLLEGEPHGRLILVRHGQSEWNRANLFTGWTDVDLTEQGISEAREAGRLLLAEGLQVDEVHTSMMRRAIRTGVLLLSTLNGCWIPVHKHYELNEQHSGMLTGKNKRELAREHGEDTVMGWRREFDHMPPPLDDDSPLQRAFRDDVRYQAVDVPGAESLRTVCARVEPLWEGTLRPALQAGKTVLVVSHGNTLRALVKKIDGVTDEDVFYLDVPTGAPLLYEFDAQLQHLRPHGLWSDKASASCVCHGRYLLDEARVKAAQLAMREQVKQDIQYSMLGADGRPAVQAAFTAPTAERALAEIDGEGYTVRQTPPAYLMQESLRREETAREDLAEFRMATRNRIVRDQKKKVRCALVLLRHGQSHYNRAKIFTGWADPDLTNRGRDEARSAGQLLRAVGITKIEVLYTSLLQRAVKTAWLALDEMDLQWTTIKHT